MRPSRCPNSNRAIISCTVPLPQLLPRHHLMQPCSYPNCYRVVISCDCATSLTVTASLTQIKDDSATTSAAYSRVQTTGYGLINELGPFHSKRGRVKEWANAFESCVLCLIFIVLVVYLYLQIYCRTWTRTRRRLWPAWDRRSRAACCRSPGCCPRFFELRRNRRSPASRDVKTTNTYTTLL